MLFIQNHKNITKIKTTILTIVMFLFFWIDDDLIKIKGINSNLAKKILSELNK